jgi:hypothetical protein
VRYTPEQQEALDRLEARRKAIEDLDQKREDERDGQYADIRHAQSTGLTSGPICRASGISDTMVRRILRAPGSPLSGKTRD